MAKDFKVRPDELISPTAKQLWSSNTVSAQSFREWIESTIPLLPQSLQRIGTLIYGIESRFKGAVWELFWWSTVHASCSDVEVETKTEAEALKSVDLIATFPTGKRIALEVSTLNEHYDSIQKEFSLSELVRYLESSLYGPYKTYQMSAVKFDLSFTDFDLVLDAMKEWINEVGYNRPINSLSEPSLRLVLRDQGVTLDFTAMGYDQFAFSKPNIMRFPIPSEKRDEKKCLRKRILDKAKKKVAVPELPLVIAITEVGGFMAGTLWSRATALVGDEQIRFFEDGSHQIVHADNGVFVGATGWRNQDISAVILCAADVPSEDFKEFEVWINGGASHPIEPEDLGFDVKYFRVNSDRIEEFQGTTSTDRWKAIPIR